MCYIPPIRHHTVIGDNEVTCRVIRKGHRSHRDRIRCNGTVCRSIREVDLPSGRFRTGLRIRQFHRHGHGQRFTIDVEATHVNVDFCRIINLIGNRLLFHRVLSGTVDVSDDVTVLIT